MSKSLAEIRAHFKALKDGKGKGDGNNKFASSEIYPFWNMKVDESATVRILPDADSENENVFFIDKLEHVLSINGKDKKIPCVWMYGEKCPICALSKKYYDAQDKVQGKYYYRNKQSLLKAVIIKDPLPADAETGKNSIGQVKTLQFNYQLMQTIMEQLAKEDSEDGEEEGLKAVAWDIDAGHNFFIKKTKGPQFDAYNVSSGFSAKVTSLPAEYAEGLEFISLKTLLPANPGVDEVTRLLNAHLNGEDEQEEAGEEEEAPARPAARPVTRKPTATEDEDEAPVARRPATKPVIEESEEDEAPVTRRPATKPVVEEEEAAEVEPEDDIMAKIGRRAKKN